jgi:hypothetical protein
MTHLEAVRAAAREAQEIRMGSWNVDDDLSREAGMDGGLGRLLQAARNLDNDAVDQAHPYYDLGYRDAICGNYRRSWDANHLIYCKGYDAGLRAPRK